MAAMIKQIRRLEGEPVRMRFEDGREEVARLLCATKDMDGSEHLVYELIEAQDGRSQGARPEVAGGPRMPQRCLYANARTLLSIEQIASSTSAVA